MCLDKRSVSYITDDFRGPFRSSDIFETKYVKARIIHERFVILFYFNKQLVAAYYIRVLNMENNSWGWGGGVTKTD